jgi:hypothetical protein
MYRILATWEAEISSITVGGQPAPSKKKKKEKNKVLGTPSQSIKSWMW